MVKVSNLIKKEENPILSANNGILGAIPIGAKLSLQESQKFLDPTTTSVGGNTNVQNQDPVFNSVGVTKNLTVDTDTIFKGKLNVSGLSVFSDQVTFMETIRCMNIKSLSDSQTGITRQSEQINLNAHVINIGRPSSIVNIYGSATSVITTDLVVRDKLISLNLAISGTSGFDIGNDSGIEIKGTSGSGFIITNQDATRYYIQAPQGTRGYIAELDLSNNLRISGFGQFYEGISCLSFLNVSGVSNLNNDVLVGSSLTVNKNTFLNGPITGSSSLFISGNSILQGSLFVSDKTTLYNDVLVDSFLAVNQNLTLKGTLLVSNKSMLTNDTTIGSTLTVNGSTILEGSVTGISSMFVSGNSILQGSLLVSSNSTLTNDTTIGSSLTVNGNTNLGNKLFFNPCIFQTLEPSQIISTYSSLNFVSSNTTTTNLGLQDGTSTGQTFILVNKSSNNISLSDGQTNIYSKTTALFVWDGSLWYPTRGTI
jgi:carbonic anhydrase/acetyltransferase-like protein (isoleucine patch superfamily)